ncbi:signal peptidase II [Mediterraneibacter agrestimuris]|uniref:signal peptidase II n=1 Tax=Mediterraneibacter agrestimuris TaxID=2941333 RepID=UPI00203B57A2|nr:signal peptidase II [Mediterraneibacter agrestimuris]
MGILVLICLTVCLALADIALKSTIEGYMTRKEERTACGGKVILRKVYNKGFSFNLLEEKREAVKYGSAYATVILTIWQLITLLQKKHYLKKWGLSLMTAGAWSNTFDRWFRGYVIDYVGFQTKWKKVTAMTFNLADFLIGAGGMMVLLASIFRRKKK